MKLKIVTLLFLVFAFHTIHIAAQTIEGEWYTPLRNKLLRVTISRDSICMKKISFDDNGQEYKYADSYKIEKEINSTYIVSNPEDTVTAYYLFGFSLDNTNRRNYMNIESFNISYPTIADAENAIVGMKKQQLRIVFVEKQEVERIKKYKDLSSMTTTDFTNYATRVIVSDSTNAIYLKNKYKLSYLYAESTGRIILADMGFNSFVKGHVFDSMLQTYAAHEETKEIFMKMIGSEK
jgi:hypothetical protein